MECTFQFTRGHQLRVCVYSTPLAKPVLPLVNKTVASSSSWSIFASTGFNMALSFSLVVMTISTVAVVRDGTMRNGFANRLVVKTVGPLKSLLTLLSSPASVTSLLDRGESSAGTPSAAIVDQNQMTLSLCVSKYSTVHCPDLIVPCARSLAALDFLTSVLLILFFRLQNSPLLVSIDPRKSQDPTLCPSLDP